MNVSGKAIKYGNNVDTDVIIPARYLAIRDKRELALHCMEDIDKDFSSKAKNANIIVAGKNFGCGSSREHAPLVIKESGIALVLAESFARIFYRNSINIGLPIIECPEAAIEAQEGDELFIDFESGKISNKTKNTQYQSASFPPFIQSIIAAGGLIPAIEKGALGEEV